MAFNSRTSKLWEWFKTHIARAPSWWLWLGRSGKNFPNSIDFKKIPHESYGSRETIKENWKVLFLRGMKVPDYKNTLLAKTIVSLISPSLVISSSKIAVLAVRIFSAKGLLSELAPVPVPGNLYILLLLSSDSWRTCVWLEAVPKMGCWVNCAVGNSLFILFMKLNRYVIMLFQNNGMLPSLHAAVMSFN